MDCIYEYGLRCDCNKSENKPRKRVIKGGRVVYGFQCQNCGRFDQKSIKSFGLKLPDQFIDESLSERFSERCKQYWNKQAEDRKSQWQAKYESYIQSQAWADKRAAVLRRDNNTCQSCLQKRAHQVHHLSYDHLGREPLWDLVAVCIDCHRALHPHMQAQEIAIDWDSLNSGTA